LLDRRARDADESRFALTYPPWDVRGHTRDGPGRFRASCVGSGQRRHTAGSVPLDRRKSGSCERVVFNRPEQPASGDGVAETIRRQATLNDPRCTESVWVIAARAELAVRPSISPAEGRRSDGRLAL
jgi:hypothetical protein